MFGEVAPFKNTLKSKEITLSFAFKNNSMTVYFKVVYEDKKRQIAVFVTSECFIGSEVTLLRMVLGP